MRMKRMSWMFGGVLAAAVVQLGAAEPQKAEPAAQPVAAKPAVVPPKALTLDELAAKLPDKLAEYNGKVLTKAELLKALAERLPGGKAPAGMTPEMFAKAAPQLTEEFVMDILLRDAMAKADVVPSEELAKAFIEKQIKEMKKEQLDMLTQMISMQKMTLDQFIKTQAANPAMQMNAALIKFAEQTFAKNIKITEADAKKFYDENPKMFTVPADPENALRASHILVMVDKNADAAAKQAALV